MNLNLPAIVYDSNALGGLVAINAGWALADLGIRIARCASKQKEHICDKI